ncbi:MAG: DUF4911 domain-containing protein [Deltaproteobacteria bacterium]|nr:DUF4911 domain-containing protein [Deltaproteobacteria bacterium]
MAEVPREIWVECRVPHAHIYFVRYTLDAYDGLCLASTVEDPSGRVRLLSTEDRADELDRVLEALAEEVPLRVVGRGTLDPGGPA